MNFHPERLNSTGQSMPGTLSRITACIGLISLSISASPAVAAPTPSAPDLTGRLRHPLQEIRQRNRRAVVLFFITTDCPIANRMAPEVNRIYRDYRARNLQFYIVYVDKKLTATAASTHAKEYGLLPAALIDREHKLVKFCGARVTPEVAVLSTAGKVLYRGRIDNRYAALGKPRLQPTSRDLRVALDAVCAGKPVTTPVTVAVGCYIEN
jgi:hypothetical protein